MATSLFFMATDQNHASRSVQELPMNTQVGSCGEIRPEPVVKTRGRKPGPKAAQNQKKEPQRGMGVEKLERLRLEEKRMMERSNPNPNTRLPIPDPVVVGTFPVLHGVPSYGGPANIGPIGSAGLSAGPVIQKVNPGCGRFGGFCCGGRLVHPPIPVDPAPICFPEALGFVETSNELSSMPNSQLYATNRCGASFKKKRCHGEGIRSNGGGNSKYTMISAMNGYDPPTFNQEIMNPSFVYEHTNAYLARTTAATGSLNCSSQIFNEGSMEMMGSYMKGNPRNRGTGMQIIKEYEFFPGKSENFPGKYGQSTYTKETEEASVVSVSDCSTNASAIDLSLKL